MEILFHALKEYSVVIFLCLSFLGFGKLTLVVTKKVNFEDKWLTTAISITLGMGIFIVSLQILGIFGLLRRFFVISILIIGFFIFLTMICRSISLTNFFNIKKFSIFSWLAISVVATTVWAPLMVPLGWDELMYHLPHARQWAQNGDLSIHEWIRYPWFPYNIDLLFSAAYLIRNDTFSHFFNALSGWLIALTIFRLGVVHANHMTALIATGLWIILTKDFYESAHTDMGIALFIFSGCIAMNQWLDNLQRKKWLYIAWFFLGIGAGSKYQALSFSLLFFIVMLYKKASVKTVSISIFCFLIPCAYWYVRNFVATGDPFDPIGGPIFGFTDWNYDDLKYQLIDLNRLKNWPSWQLWPAILTPLLAKAKFIKSVHRGFIFSLYSFVVWYITSHYDRYLTSAYPVITLLSAYVVVIFLNAFKSEFTFSKDKIVTPLKYTFFIAFFSYLFIKVHDNFEQYKPFISLTYEDRATIVNGRFPENKIYEQLKLSPLTKIYQWGLERSFYYAPVPVWGDHFGNWRYRDFQNSDPKKMAQKLAKDHFKIIIVNPEYILAFETGINFNLYFEEILESRGAKAYRIIFENIDY